MLKWSSLNLPRLAKQVWEEVGRDQVEVMAGGVAFFATLSLFPAVVALVLVYGLVAEPAALEGQLTWLALSLVPSARDVLSDSLRLAAQDRTSFGVGALVALGLAVYGASRATNALLIAVQAAYDDDELRGFFSQLRINLIFTAVPLIGTAALLASAALAPGALERLGLGQGVISAVLLLRWPLIWIGCFLGLLVLYRFAPQKKVREQQPFTWPGALLATLLWTLASTGFGFYTVKVDSYDGSYGSAAAFAVFMTWLYLSALAVMIGAEFNSELGKQLGTGATAPARDESRAARSS